MRGRPLIEHDIANDKVDWPLQGGHGQVSVAQVPLLGRGDEKEANHLLVLSESIYHRKIACMNTKPPILFVSTGQNIRVSLQYYIIGTQMVYKPSLTNTFQNQSSLQHVRVLWNFDMGWWWWGKHYKNYWILWLPWGQGQNSQKSYNL